MVIRPIAGMEHFPALFLIASMVYIQCKDECPSNQILEASTNVTVSLPMVSALCSIPLGT